MEELKPHIFHSISEVYGSIGLQSLLVMLHSSRMPVNPLWKDFLADWFLKAVAPVDIQASKGTVSYIPTLLPGDEQKIGQEVQRVLFHERFHYWQLVSTTAMATSLLAHIRLIEERIIFEGGSTIKILPTQPFFEQDVFSKEKDTRSEFLIRAIGYYLIKNNLEDERNKYVLRTYDWIKLLEYLLWVVNYTEVKFVKKPEGYFIRKSLSETAYVAMSRQSTLLDVIVRYLPLRDEFVVTPMSAAVLMESQAYVAECLFYNKAPSFPNENELSKSWFIYREPWLAWKDLYGDLFADQFTAARAFVATIDLALSTDWIGQKRYRGDADFFSEMVSPSYRFAVILRAHRRIRSGLKEISEEDAIDWLSYQEQICQIMGWPNPKETTGRLLEFVMLLNAATCAGFGYFDQEYLNKLIGESNTKLDYFYLLEQFHIARYKRGPTTLVDFQSILETIMHFLYLRYSFTSEWVDRLVVPERYLGENSLDTFRELIKIGLPVFWMGDRLVSEWGGAGEKNDFMRYITLHGIASLNTIDEAYYRALISYLKTFGNRPLRLDFDSTASPFRCGIEEQDIECDHMFVGFTCPFKSIEPTSKIATKCYYVDIMKRIGLSKGIP